MSAKQDRQGVRTAAQLEQKWKFGETFAKVMGIAEDAQRKAEEAGNSLEGLDQEAIFNILTNNGQAQGLYRDDDGNIFINASYIAAGILSSKDGKIKIDLASGGEPVFNTGVVTNGLTIRGEQLGTGDLLRVFAKVFDKGTSHEHTSVVINLTGADGTGLGALGELVMEDDGSPAGVTAYLTNAQQDMMLNLKTTPGFASYNLLVTDPVAKTETNVGSFYASQSGRSYLKCHTINPGKAVLFTGNVAIGSTFEVPYTEHYDLFAVKLGTSSTTENTVVLAYKVGNTIRGVGGWSGDATQHIKMFFLSATFSGDTWTVVDTTSKELIGTSVGSSAKLNVKEVVGVI